MISFNNFDQTTMIRICTLCILGGLLSSPLSAQAPPAQEIEHAPTTEDRFAIRNIEGWTVYINREVLAEYPAQSAETLEHLKWELYQIKLAAPERAVTNMQENNAIWIEYREDVDLSYHPSRQWLIEHGYTVPRDPQSFMSLSLATHFNDSYRHPFVVFHEMAHAFDFHFIGKADRYGNDESQQIYERMMAEGKYESVKIWDGRTGSHYARTNRMEYWAESTEAYFAINDIYPFVRAELREHDPKMVRFVERYWGVNVAEIQKLEKELVAYQNEWQQPTDRLPQLNRPATRTTIFVATDEYETLNVKGWTVYLSPELTRQPGIREKILTFVAYKLHMIDHFISAEAREQLQVVPIWLEIGKGGPYLQYHGSSEQLQNQALNPDKFQAVEIRDPQRMMDWALLQQSDLLHALSLAYYDRFITKKNPALKAAIQTAFQNAQNEGNYRSVLRFDGKHPSHPALQNERRYFAELMESYFLVNDHYPFNRRELKDHDPAGAELIANIWQGNPNR